MADCKAKPDLPFMMRLKLSIGSFLFQFCQRPDGTINHGLLNLLDPKTSADTTVIIGNIPLATSDSVSRVSVHSKTCDDFCRTLAGEMPAIVASINYSLAPDHKYPCQYEDGFDALKFINTQNYPILPANTDISKRFLAGDSAGGNIAHHVALRASQNSRVFNKIVLAGLVAVQPFFGWEERRLTKAPVINADAADTLWRMFLPVGADRNHPAVNVFGCRDDAKIVECMKSIEFPSTLVIVGGYDPLQDWQKRYAEGLEKCGKEVLVEYPNAIHSFYAFKELPEYGLFVEDKHSNSISSMDHKIDHTEWTQQENYDAEFEWMQLEQDIINILNSDSDHQQAENAVLSSEIDHGGLDDEETICKYQSTSYNGDDDQSISQVSYDYDTELLRPATDEHVQETAYVSELESALGRSWTPDDAMRIFSRMNREIENRGCISLALNLD
ncbi:hypothetical protein Pfo_002015 [Paulownia fortunei]|nr:hypothetical protein Pfo_002015 [Paulownia fortunei]